MADVFLSYSRKNAAVAEVLRGLLEAEGWSVWWDPEIRVGKVWRDELDKALDQSRAIVVLWTPEAAASEWVRKEASFGLDQEKLFGVLAEDCGVPEPFPQREMAVMPGWRGAPDHPELLQLFRSLAERVPPSRIDTVRPGYDSRFLGEDRRVPWPAVHGTARQLHYLHFSVVMNPARRLAWYVAYNVDLQQKEGAVERADRWMPDPLVALELQPSDEHFKRSGYDRGHLVARSHLTWGAPRQAWISSHQAFFWTNTAPQHPFVNRGSYLAVELWERALAERKGRLAGLCGPVFHPDDPPFRDEQRGDDGFVAYGTYRIPRAFWKVVCGLDDEGALALRAFHFDNPSPDERVRAGRPRALDFAVPLERVQQITGLEFAPELLAAPPLA
ncbi:MAG: TIR domain-containing protein [Acidobacteria bacterium]|nr:TIR domain-containing protein [Acidobacteriota bacterium]